jgi:hypothetical protein
MKKQFILILCCLVFLISATAQPKAGNIPVKFSEKIKKEKLNRKMNLDKENSLSFLINAVSSKMNSTQSQKSNDWWEPDTIYQYQGYGYAFEVRRIFSYSNGLCKSELWQARDGNQWEIFGRITNSYDSKNNKTETIFQGWEGNQWENAMRYLYKYDEHSNMTEKRFQFWEGYWFTEEMITYAYDSQNRIIEKVFYSDWGDELDLEDKIIYEYDSQNNIIKERHLYEIDEDEWEEFVNIIFTYDAQNKLTEAVYQVIEDDVFDFIILSVTYDEQNNTTTHQYTARDWWDENEWDDVVRIIFTYDAQNNLISELWQEFDEEKWEDFEQYTYSYDENNNAKDGYLWQSYKKGFIWDWEDGRAELTVYYNNMQSKISTFQFDKFTATYTKQEVGIKENHLLKNSVILYPNPVSNILYIETNKAIAPEVKIYSIQGVLSVSIKGNQIDVSSLPSGIYIAEVDGVSKKIVKQ